MMTPHFHSSLEALITSLGQKSATKPIRIINQPNIYLGAQIYQAVKNTHRIGSVKREPICNVLGAQKALNPLGPLTKLQLKTCPEPTVIHPLHYLQERLDLIQKTRWMST